MRNQRSLIAPLLALLPISHACGYTLSISPSSIPLGAPAAGASMTLTIRLDGAAGESILSAQALVQVTDSLNSSVSGLTLSGGTGLGAGMIFAQYSDPASGHLSTQFASSPTLNSRYRALYVPTDAEGFPVPQTLADGILMTVVLNIPAGLPAGTYAISHWRRHFRWIKWDRHVHQPFG